MLLPSCSSGGPGARTSQTRSGNEPEPPGRHQQLLSLRSSRPEKEAQVKCCPGESWGEAGCSVRPPREQAHLGCLHVSRHLCEHSVDNAALQTGVISLQDVLEAAVRLRSLTLGRDHDTSCFALIPGQLRAAAPHSGEPTGSTSASCPSLRPATPRSRGSSSPGKRPSTRHQPGTTVQG